MQKNEIRQHATAVVDSLEESLRAFPPAVSITEYAHMRTSAFHGETAVQSWSSALETALREHEHVYFPASDEPYFFDRTVIVPSSRYIECDRDATLAQTFPATEILFRNEHVVDGSRIPEAEQDVPRDHDIYITGGRFIDPHNARAGYGRSGMLDRNTYHTRFHGVSTLLFFNHIDRFYIAHTTFVHCAAFAVQCGDLCDGAFLDLTMEGCFADGVHLGGNCRRLCIRSIRGEVGDDLVALNAYDWQNSSVNFGPMDTVWCQDLHQYETSRYKAMRIEPGIYTYADGTTVDCALTNALIEDVRGVSTFKMYFQTPPYKIRSEKPEAGVPGSSDWIYFRNIDVHMMEPTDMMPGYVDSDPVVGTCAVFEIGSNIGHLSLENVRMFLNREEYPYLYMLSVGPKSVRMERGTEKELEIFDPNLCCEAGEVRIHGVTVNGVEYTGDGIREFIREIRFDDVYGDGTACGHGSIRSLILD